MKIAGRLVPVDGWLSVCPPHNDGIRVSFFFYSCGVIRTCPEFWRLIEQQLLHMIMTFASFTIHLRTWICWTTTASWHPEVGSTCTPVSKKMVLCGSEEVDADTNCNNLSWLFLLTDSVPHPDFFVYFLLNEEKYFDALDALPAWRPDFSDPVIRRFDFLIPSLVSTFYGQFFATSVSGGCLEAIR